MERIDCLVIGAGVVGLAVARALAQAGREVLIAEAATAIGTGTSARNSEVIHAGLYYPPGSRKARWCVAGRDALYAYCATRGIAHRRCGKLIVATSSAQHAQLDAIAARAAACGVHDLVRLDAAAAQAMEPALRCTGALWSPSTGIVDSHGLMLALLADAEAAGAVLALASALAGGAVQTDGIRLDFASDPPLSLLAREVVNCAGLQAPAVAASIAGFPRQTVPAARYCKGSYFTVPGAAAFSRLVYPIPEAAGLGVHVTLDLAGQMRFGPDTEWIDVPPGREPDYRVDPARAAAFEHAIRAYWPALPAGALVPAYAGVRPKIHGADEPAADFRLDGPATHGVPGCVQLYGIESPGLTASLAIADAVVAALDPPAA